MKEYATFDLDPIYGSARLSGDGTDHPFCDTGKLNKLAKKGWRVIGCHFNTTTKHQQRWGLLLERDVILDRENDKP